MLAPGALLLFLALRSCRRGSCRRSPPLLGASPPRIGGSAGALARRNAMRNPGRTASTAAALMIGIALVAFSAVLGNGMRESMKGAIADQVRADYVLVGQDGWSPIDPTATAAAAAVPGSDDRERDRPGPGPGVRRRLRVDGVDTAAITEVFGSTGSRARTPPSPSSAGPRGRDEDVRRRSRPGDGRPLRGHRAGGEPLELDVAGITDPDKFNPLELGEVTIGRCDVRLRVHRRARALRVRQREDGDSARPRRRSSGPWPGSRPSKLQTEGGVPARPVDVGRPDPRDLLRPARRWR